MRNTNRHPEMRGVKNPKHRIKEQRRLRMSAMCNDMSAANRAVAKDARKDVKRMRDMAYGKLTPNKPGSFMHGKKGNGRSTVNTKRGHHGYSGHAAQSIMWPKPTGRGMTSARHSSK